MLYCSRNMFCTFTLALSIVCVQCPILLCFVFPWFCAFLLCCSGIVSVILKWFQLPLLLPVSLLLSHSSCAEFLFWGLYILKSSQLSWWHFCLQKFQHLLKCMFLFYYHRLCLVYCEVLLLLLLLSAAPPPPPSSLLSLLCRVFSIMYMKQTMFLGYIMLQLFCIYNLCYT